MFISSLLLLNGKKRHSKKVITNNSILISRFVDKEPEKSLRTNPKEIVKKLSATRKLVKNNLTSNR